MSFNKRSSLNDRRKSARRQTNKSIDFRDKRIEERRLLDRRSNIEELQEAYRKNEILIKNIKKSLQRRVVITGMGVVAPNGIGKDAFWKAIKEGKNCVDRITSFDPSGFPSQVAAEIKNFNPEDFIAARDVHKMARSSHLAIAAAKEAVKDSKLKIELSNTSQIGVIVGAGAAGIEYAEKEMYKFWHEGHNKISPYASTASFSGSLSGNLSRILNVKGISLTVSNGCTGGNDAIGYALNSIRHGMCDIIFTGGAESLIIPSFVEAFCQLGALSTKRNHEPKKACRPFNIDRDGFVIGEGAWIIVLEELEHALRRKAIIYAEIIGYGATCDAYHITRPLPSGEETANAMKHALRDASIEPEEVDYINAHGTSTPLNDKSETLAIKKAFGKHAFSLAVSSTKSMIGHPQGASGACGVAVSALAIFNNFLPATINYENPDPECDLDYVPNKGRNAIVNVALSNSIGFGSKNSTIVLKKFTTF